MASNNIVTVTGYSSGGEGVARLDDGRVVFIPGAARGDILEIILTQEKTRSAHGEICNIISPSGYRIDSDCPYYLQCGGCDFRHINYEEELWAKLQRVNDALSRIAGLSIRAEEILTTGQTDAYRNKAVFNYSDGRPALYCKHSHNSIPIEHCLLLKNDINESLRTLPQLKKSAKITVRSGRSGVVVSACDGARKSASLKSTQLEEELDGLIFGISGFFQVNSGAALLLYQRAREYAAMSSDELLVDFYCGVGSLTIFVGRDARAAVGIELEKAAIKKARDNARRNNLNNIRFICADAASDWSLENVDIQGCHHDALSSRNHALDILSSGAAKPDCIIVDPPRKGLSSGALRKVLELAPSRIVYVSCDPATLARDLRALEGYCVSNICAVDMFPRTANVECCCLLRRK